MKPLTFPHSVIGEKCQQICNTRWEQLAGVVNSLELYYGRITKEELDKHNEIYVDVAITDLREIKPEKK